MAIATKADLKKVKDLAESMKLELPRSVIKEFARKTKDLKFTEKQQKDALKKVHGLFLEARVTPGEAVGTVAAQSIGEPNTQGALRSFHFAGAMSVSSGLDRAQELFTAAKTIKTPQMVINLKPEIAKNEKKIDHFIERLIETQLKDVAKITKHLKDKKLTIQLKENAPKYIKITDVEATVEKILKEKPKIKGDTAEVTFKEAPLKKIALSAIKLEDSVVSGVKGITAAVKQDLGSGEYVVYTKGSNMKEVIQLNDVDPQRIFTNDIKQVEGFLGIEAARNVFMDEMKKVYSDSEYVDKRHLLLAADAMTFKGKLEAVGRTGVSGGKQSVLAKAAFEETSKNLFDAVLFGDKETFQGVAENIIVGKLINLGTGMVKVMVKQDKK